MNKLQTQHSKQSALCIICESQSAKQMEILAAHGSSNVLLSNRASCVCFRTTTWILETCFVSKHLEYKSTETALSFQSITRLTVHFPTRLSQLRS